MKKNDKTVSDTKIVEALTDKVPEEKPKSLSNHDVTAHTANLWKYKPVPDAPEPYPEYTNRYQKDEAGEIIGARVRGKKHKHEGTNCDDWFEFQTYDKCVFAVVSDGAGSKVFSRIGAKVSCETVINSMITAYTDILKQDKDIKKKLGQEFDSENFNSSCSKLATALQQSVINARNAVNDAFLERKNNEDFKKAVNRDIELKDFSATLLVAVAIPVVVNKNKEHLILSVQVGDGCIFSVNKESPYADALRLLGIADGGAFAGETDFLTSESMSTMNEMQKRTKIQRRKVTSLMLMTDGVADDYYPNNPQMLRLYTDLLLNGIIKLDGSSNTVTEQNRKFVSNVPEPVEYPWVNDGDIKYTLQYSNNIISSASITLEELWKNADVQRISSLESFDKKIDGDDASEKLLTWLDNYVERGSFDDRTLIIINLGDAI